RARGGAGGAGACGRGGDAARRSLDRGLGRAHSHAPAAARAGAGRPLSARRGRGRTYDKRPGAARRLKLPEAPSERTPLSEESPPEAVTRQGGGFSMGLSSAPRRALLLVTAAAMYATLGTGASTAAASLAPAAH